LCSTAIVVGAPSPSTGSSSGSVLPPPPSGNVVGSLTSSQMPVMPRSYAESTSEPHHARVAARETSGNAAGPGHATPVAPRKCPPATPLS
jgi:hypothetical protein